MSHYNYSVFWKVHVACDFNFIVNGEVFLKITDGQVHWKSGNISEMVLDRDVVITGHKQEVILVYGLSNSSKCNGLECP